MADKHPVSRPHLSLRRLLLLTVVTAAVAFALQAVLAATDAPGASTLNLALVPPAAGAIVFVGLRPYPVTGRLRLGLMVAVGLFLVGLSL